MTTFYYKQVTKLVEDIFRIIARLGFDADASTLLLIMKNAVAVLTRGYENVNEYDTLINRTSSINLHASNAKFDHLIFHEGNIIEDHQDYIRSKITPCNQNIIFIHAGGDFNRNFDNPKFYSGTEQFSLNYRHMCNFWFAKFLRYVRAYDNILRIDEDCIIKFDCNESFKKLNDKVMIYGEWVSDQDFVTTNLNQTVLVWANLFSPFVNTTLPIEISGPYTNIIGFNIKKIMERESLHWFIQFIDNSLGIYYYRWGDHMLWGQALGYLFKPGDHYLDRSMKYYHGSHHCWVNE